MTRFAEISRRDLLAWGSLLGLAPFAAQADTYPNRSISLVVGAPPGGSVDFGARVLMRPLSEVLGVPVVVDNKPGATGVIGAKLVAKAAADGYTLLLATPTSVVLAPQTMPGDAFNTPRDMVGINMVAKNPLAIAISPALKIDNLKDLVALSRTRPVTLGQSGSGGSFDLLIKQLAKVTGGNFDSIPYKGVGPAITDAIGGQLDGVVSDLGPCLSFHQSGKLKIVAVTSEKRIASLPNVAAASETYPALVTYNWLGLFAPAKTPPDVVNKVNAALLKILAREDVKTQFTQSANIVSSMKGPAEFQAFVAGEYKRWGAVLKEQGMI
ncbi:tripartite tricarboxylate transporter substrate binding protein [Ramlibacter sp. WS9]|uniref:Bug family tripartite tricarboxylate transporter substrate binding protein n=1 Tax=Ramlibacter sp. WS9 TaxID=1882741 RepID=UPI001141F31A|nr:tripartite tricarboxylate transporter substrate binding protein [Ramlibacter sp. WS9]ROZ79829.1 tripartite tricarboxylate transporter substrate binding protein [Ramlibacter sp. WS9]